jgi:hypothetical protein
VFYGKDRMLPRRNSSGGLATFSSPFFPNKLRGKEDEEERRQQKMVHSVDYLLFLTKGEVSCLPLCLHQTRGEEERVPFPPPAAVLTP